MSAIFESAASLRFFGDDLDPDELTSLLGATPTVGVRKGAARRMSSGRELVERTGSWRLQVVRRRPGDLDGQIAEILDQLTPNLAIWTSLAARYQADIFCGVFLGSGNDGFSLHPQTTAAVGARGLTIEFDVYENGSG
jgi:hypothetical protein